MTVNHAAEIHADLGTGHDAYISSAPLGITCRSFRPLSPCSLDHGPPAGTRRRTDIFVVPLSWSGPHYPLVLFFRDWPFNITRIIHYIRQWTDVNSRNNEPNKLLALSERHMCVLCVRNSKKLLIIKFIYRICKKKRRDKKTWKIFYVFLMSLDRKINVTYKNKIILQIKNSVCILQILT